MTRKSSLVAGEPSALFQLVYNGIVDKHIQEFNMDAGNNFLQVTPGYFRRFQLQPYHN